jgi:hypothetical protein
MTAPSHQGCWPRKGKHSQRAPNYGANERGCQAVTWCQAASLSQGACDTSQAGRGIGQGGVGLGRRQWSEQACRQQGQHGQRKQSPHPSLLPPGRRQTFHQRHRQCVGGGGGGSLIWSCPSKFPGSPRPHPFPKGPIWRLGGWEVKQGDRVSAREWRMSLLYPSPNFSCSP